MTAWEARYDAGHQERLPAVRGRDAALAQLPPAGGDGPRRGSVDGLDAVRQSVRLILSVERYHWLIHSWQYGVELSDLFGKPLSYALPEIERRIREALLQDDRVSDVRDFTFTKGRGGVVTAAFTVVTTLGELRESREVTI